MLKRYGEKALEESAKCLDELAAGEDYDGVAIWRRITTAVQQLANNTPPGPLH
jgi:hypothetical protein